MRIAASFLSSAFCVLRSAFMSLLNEGHLIDLSQRGSPFVDFLQGRLAQEGHPFLFGGFLDLGSRASIENHAANTIGEVEKFRDRRAAVETGAVAFEAASSLPERVVAIDSRIEARLDEERIGI